MSLYNMIHGVDPTAPLVLALLGEESSYFGRLRDAWVERDASGNLRLAVYTRNGGDNREHYSYPESEVASAGPACSCTGCIITYRLPQHPLYESDRDDDYDSTYATVYFRVPDDWKARLHARFGIEIPEDAELRDLAIDRPNTKERWETAIAAIGK